MYTILINSSDGYDDCWIPFFSLFKKYWPKCKVPIVLNTDFKIFNFSGLNIKSTQVNLGIIRRLTWSECLIEAINKIDTPLILYFQEDYFLEKPVMVEIIDEFAQKMISETSIKYVGLTHFASYNLSKQWAGDNRLWEVSKNSRYRISTQCGLWDKKTLLSYLRPEENGWMFEIFGTQRAKRREDLFLSISRDLYNEKNSIISYQLTGIVKGKWLDNMPILFAKEEIEMDFSKRGFYKETKPIFRKIETLRKLLKNRTLVYKGLRGL